MSDEIHDIISRLGNLEGTVRTFMNQWMRQDQTAAAGRIVTHDRMALLTQQIDRMATDVQNVQQDVAELKNDIEDKIMPSVQSYEAAQQQKLGAKTVWAAIWAAAVAAVGTLAYMIDRAVSFLATRP
jgi:oligoribonuclease (3'-5' exoribonuclease)